jgi:hypothetical protein
MNMKELEVHAEQELVDCLAEALQPKGLDPQLKKDSFYQLSIRG